MIGRARLSALAVLALVAWLSLTAAPPSVDGLPAHADLIVHFLMHLANAAALGVAWPGLIGRGAAVAAAAVFEIAQIQVPGRSFSALDLAANGAGLVAGLALAALFRRAAGRRFGLS